MPAAAELGVYHVGMAAPTDDWPEGVPRCTARSSQTGRRCRKRPMKGATVCETHGGRAPQVKAAAARRLAEQAAAEAVAIYGLPVDVSPTEALLEEVRWTAGHVAWLRARVQEVEERQLTAGVAEQRIDPEGGKTVIIKTTAHIWVELYQRERRHLVDVCAAALKAGVEERQIRLAERQGDLVAAAIEAILGDLELSPAQQARVSEVVPRHLRAITAGDMA